MGGNPQSERKIPDRKQKSQYASDPMVRGEKTGKSVLHIPRGHAILRAV